MLPKTYSPADVEGAIYQSWLDSGAFHPTPDVRRRYVIMMPLPNVTGALHMGHAMDNVMQDLLIRWQRMQGANTLWMPGTDHAGIGTQAVIEKRLKELEGKTRHDVGRVGLVQRIWEWKDKYEQRIIQQQQRMGCSCDWPRHRFTMDDICARAVRHAFFRMFRDGLIYRGERLVNWDVYLQTSVSDDEVYHETVQGHFWHLRYPVIDPKPGEPTHIAVATTRPETMLGDTAVAVHPDPASVLPPGERLAAMEQLRDMARDGRCLRLPLQERSIPMLCDRWAKPDLGSGAVKITPAHDPNDYDVWTRHRDRVGIINILRVDGTLNDNAGAYAGMDRFAARRRVVEDLERQGLVERVEDRAIDLGHSDRSKTPIEPFLSEQWFVRMGDVEGGVRLASGSRVAGLVQAAMDAVSEGRVRFHPARYAKTYLDWLAEKRDWPISRQLWWGHRIPVWSRRGGDAPKIEGDLACVRVHDGTVDVCLREDDPALLAQLQDEGFVQDPDVLDTWFSSALWPFSTLHWPDDTALLRTYYPGSCLVTGRDIITLWVARMVLAGLYHVGDVPFGDVFIHANILDGNGERMSKSKGNGIDPVDIIECYGTDAMRYVLCDMQTGTQDIRLPVTAICPRCAAENDLAKTKTGRTIFVRICGACAGEFDVLGTLPDIPAGKLISKRFEIGRAFCTKLWNSARFAFMNLEGGAEEGTLQLEDRWVLDALNRTVAAVHAHLHDYNPSAALNAARNFFWGELCDWYLELIKGRQDSGARRVLAYCLDQVLRLLHPFVPFITEYLWQELCTHVADRSLGVSRLQCAGPLLSAPWPTPVAGLVDEDAQRAFGAQQEVARAIREVRATHGLPLRAPLRATLKGVLADTKIAERAALCTIELDPAAVRGPGSAVRRIGAGMLFVHESIDDAQEKSRLEKEVVRLQKEVVQGQSKLANVGFVARAPAEVVAEHRERLSRDGRSLEEVRAMLQLLTQTT
jgi:valyl-tRNA synthetase